jgi:ferredoxin
MRIHIDVERCAGHGRCYALAPELFEADEIGNSHERGDGTVTPEHEQLGRIAAANCPEHAVVTIEEAT